MGTSREDEGTSAFDATDRAAAGLLALYDESLNEVYGYLLRRCGQPPVAEDLCAETFMAAVTAVQSGRSEPPTMPWIIGIARNKLVDHWRRAERERKKEDALGQTLDELADDWNELVERQRTNEVLAELAPQHQAALSLRYLDGLPVADIAARLDRTVHATEALLMRSKAAFRTAYEAEGSTDV